MTAREAFVFGWMFGLLRRADGPNSKLGGDFVAACTRPYSGSAKAIAEANRKGLLAGEIDRQIMEAMAEIHSFPDELPEPVQPLELQGETGAGIPMGERESVSKQTKLGQATETANVKYPPPPGRKPKGGGCPFSDF